MWKSNISILHGNVETIQSNISILRSNIETLTDDLDTLETTFTSHGTTLSSHISSLASHAGLIQNNITAIGDIFDFNETVATEPWVSGRGYATVTYVNGLVVTAVHGLIDISLSGYASSSSLASTNQAISDLSDSVDNSKVAKPLNWLTTLGISTTQPNGSLNSYVDNKIAGDQFVMFKPSDWCSIHHL